VDSGQIERAVANTILSVPTRGHSMCHGQVLWMKFSPQSKRHPLVKYFIDKNPKEFFQFAVSAKFVSPGQAWQFGEIMGLEPHSQTSCTSGLIGVSL
jgi:hypothetical protein